MYNCTHFHQISILIPNMGMKLNHSKISENLWNTQITHLQYIYNFPSMTANHNRSVHHLLSWYNYDMFVIFHTDSKYGYEIRNFWFFLTVSVIYFHFYPWLQSTTDQFIICYHGIYMIWLSFFWSNFNTDYKYGMKFNISEISDCFFQKSFVSHLQYIFRPRLQCMMDPFITRYHGISKIWLYIFWSIFHTTSKYEYWI